MSIVEDAIERMTNHGLNSVTDRPRVFSRDCKLLSGEEPYFVALLSNNIQQHLALNGLVIPYEQLFYSPSRYTEWMVGFDLSIGRINTVHRLRTMHKVLYGNWCDSSWKWENEPNDNLHMATLIANCHRHNSLLAYFVLHICYCVHDYRRMGLPSDEGWALPPFPSLLRTVVVDLVGLSKRSDTLKRIDWQNMADRFDACKIKAEARKVLASYPPFTLMLEKDISSVDTSLCPQEYLKQCEAKTLFKLRCGEKEDHIAEPLLEFQALADMTLDWGRHYWNQDHASVPSEM